MKKLLLPALLATSFFLASALPTLAAPVGGQLIKASGPAVYYMGMDGKRYVFPNEATYRTWYSDFSTVQTITDSELAQVMIGGNVTYRPGVRLVKITTDPKVYAVAGNGTLRWVANESVAVSLFGSNWATQVDDIPDAFFINYHIGTSINAASEFDRNQELSLSTSIALDRARGTTSAPTIPIPPVETPTTTVPTSTTPTTPTSTAPSPYQGNLTLQATGSITSGSAFTVIARPSISGGLTSIVLWDASGTRILCESDFCLPRFNAPVVTATSTDTITGVFTWIGPRYATTTLDVTVVPIVYSSQITYTSPTSTIYEDATREVTVRVGSGFVPHVISVYMDGYLVKQCLDDSICTVSQTEQRSAGTQHIFTSSAQNLNGEIINGGPYIIRVIARPGTS